MSNARNIASGAKFVETAGDSMTGELLVRRARSNTAGDAALTIHPSDTTVSYGMRIDQNTNSLNFDQVNSGVTRMSIDSAGRVTTPSQPAFGIKMNAVSGINATSSTIVIAGSAYFNSSSLQQTGGSNFAVGTGRFTAPVSGFYQFNVSIRFDGHSGNYIYITLVDNGAAISRNLTSLGFTYMTLTMSKAHYLHANDYVEIHINCSADTSVVLDGDSYFSGYLIG